MSGKCYKALGVVGRLEKLQMPKVHLSFRPIITLRNVKNSLEPTLNHHANTCTLEGDVVGFSIWQISS